jgi:hypothetical protein
VQAIRMLEELMARHGRSAELVFRMAELSDEESRYEQVLELDHAVQDARGLRRDVGARTAC